MKNARRFAGIVAFFLIFTSIFLESDRILSRKSLDGWWNVTEKLDGFYNSPKGEYEVIYFGSSNAYCSFNPLEIWKQSGVKSYVFATQQQPIWATYHYMVDAFRYQSPKLAVMDILMLSKNDEYYDDGVNYTFCDNMPLSTNKVRLAFASAPYGDRFGLICRFVKYHSRWSELTKEDFEYRAADMNDYSKGYYVLTNTCPDAVHTDTSDVTDTTALSEKNLKYMQKIIDLCKKEGVQLMLVKTPSNSTSEEKQYYNAAEHLAQKNGVPYVDYNQLYDEIGLDLNTDFFDKTHLNVLGAEKFSRYFTENTDYFSGRSVQNEDWSAEYDKYRKTVNEFIEQNNI